MVFDTQFFLGLVGPVLLLVGVIITVLATRGRTQSDYKTAMDKRIDEKMKAYQEDLEERLTAAEEKAEKAKGEAKELASRVKTLEVDRKLSDRRELLLYFHTKALRDHILNEMPPPPPSAPPELVDWFESFEDTLPPGLA